MNKYTLGMLLLQRGSRNHCGFYPKKGGRVWITLDFPGRELKVKDAYKQVHLAKDLESLTHIASSLPCATHFPKFKNPYFRLQRTDIGLIKKFYHVHDHFGSCKEALLRMLQVAAITAKHQDDVECMQVPELKNLLVEKGLSKTGSHIVLQTRMLEHLVSTVGAAETASDKSEPKEKNSVGPVEQGGIGETATGVEESEPQAKNTVKKGSVKEKAKIPSKDTCEPKKVKEKVSSKQPKEIAQGEKAVPKDHNADLSKSNTDKIIKGSMFCKYFAARLQYWQCFLCN